LLLAACGGGAAPASTAPASSGTAKPAASTAAPASAAASAKPATSTAGSAEAKPKPAARTKISIAQGLPLGNPSNPFAWIGKELGYFDAENVDAEIISLGGDNAKGDAMMASGQIEAAILGLEQILRGAAKGNDVPAKAVFNVQSKSQYEGVVLTDSPVKTVADLKGKTVAIPQLGATLETYVNAALVDAGQKAGDAKFLATGIGPQMGEALKRGEVAAAYGTFGQISPLRQQGYNIRYLPPPSFANGFITGNFVARSNLQPAQVDAMKGYLRAYAKSIVFTKENPEAAVKISWKMFPEAKPKSQSEDQALQTAIQINKEYMSYIDKLDGKWGYMPPDRMLSYLKFLDLEGKVDVTKYYSNDWIAFINDFDEAKIKEQARTYKI
jgi:NitT/TauT family transport system substrate-binding protein